MTIGFNQYFTLSIDLYLPNTETIEERLKTCGFDFTKKVVNAHNHRTNFLIECKPAHMEKVMSIINETE